MNEREREELRDLKNRLNRLQYDFDKLKGEISIRFSKKGEKFKALDGKEYELGEKNIVICDENGIISLAGIIGAEHCAISSSTKNALIESAFFPPDLMANKARELKLQTESSQRFERGVDFDLPKNALILLQDISSKYSLYKFSDIEVYENYTFLHGDISDETCINSIFNQYKFDAVVHLAAESHVDRSISNPLTFAKTNILGTIVLLNAFKSLWQGNWADKRFYHISTDEVYGTLKDEGLFKEDTAYDPNSPYSASKASSDHFVRAYGETYGLPYVISNCSNNYGPYHFPEKLIPVMILNALVGKPLPIYGDGGNIRDWLYVEDHADALLLVLEKGELGRS